MELRRLGKTGLEITPVGLGCWQFSRGKGLVGNYWSTIEMEDIDKIVSEALEGGINWFDTAEAYGWGESERNLAAALHKADKLSQDIIVATKWFPSFRTAKNLVTSIDDRLKALNGYPIDLYQVHNPTSFSPIRVQMEAMIKLLKEKKIRAVGVSNFSTHQMEKAHATLQNAGFSLASNQVHYNLLKRQIEHNGLLKKARDLGITIIAYSPLAQGILTGSYHRDPEKREQLQGPRRFLRKFQAANFQRTAPLITELEKIARAYGVTPAQIALNWLIHFHGTQVVVIPGASKPEQAKSNTAVMRFKLNDKELQKLDEISRAVSV